MIILHIQLLNKQHDGDQIFKRVRERLKARLQVACAEPRKLESEWIMEIAIKMGVLSWRDIFREVQSAGGEIHAYYEDDK